MSGLLERLRERLSSAGVAVAQEHAQVVIETIDAAARERQRSDEQRRSWLAFERQLNHRRTLAWEDMTGDSPAGHGEPR